MRKVFNKIRTENHFQSALAQLVPAAVALLGFMMLARGLDKNTFGRWMFYIVAINFVDMLKAGILQSAFIKFASGLNKVQQDRFLIASIRLHLKFNLLIFLVAIVLFFALKSWEYKFLVIAYPLYSIFSLPFFHTLWNYQLQLKFNKIFFSRVVSATLLALLYLSCLFYSHSFYRLVLAHGIIFLLCSAFLPSSIGKKIWFQLLDKKDAEEKKLLAFGKYNLLVFLGSNMLKSFDTFIINFLAGPTVLAIYSIPLKLVELIEMPLRSIGAVAYPVFSDLHNRDQAQEINARFNLYVSRLLMFYLPFLTVLFIFAEELVVLIGGEKYIDSANIFRVFVIYGVFLVFDRFTGIFLDSLGKPKLNFFKVGLMLSLNIVGDLLAWHLFESLFLIALVTLLNVILGCIIGYFFIKRENNYQLSNLVIRLTNLKSLKP